MTAVQLGSTFYRRDVAHNPRAAVRNLIFEPDPTNQVDGKGWIKRPGLVALGGPLAGGIRGLFQQDGSFNGDLLVVAGNTLYRQPVTGAATPLGAVAGSDVATAALTSTRALVACGGALYAYDGSGVSQVAMPDGVPVSWVAYLANYFVIGQAGSQRVYFMASTATAPDALDFFSAESQPDNLIVGHTLGGTLWLFGQSSVEVWQPSGDQNLPFSRILGQSYGKGVASAACVAQADNTLFFVGDDLIVYRADTVPVRISDSSIEERLRHDVATTLTAWAFALDGHTYYVLTSATASSVYDVSTGKWSRWSRIADTRFSGQLGVQVDGATVVCGATDGTQLFTLSPDALSDAGDPMLCQLTGIVPVVGPPQRCDSLHVVMTTGYPPQTLNVTWSDDQGQTYPGVRNLDLGGAGEFDQRLTMRQLGRMRSPGRAFLFDVSTTGPVRFSTVSVNDLDGIQ